MKIHSRFPASLAALLPAALCFLSVQAGAQVTSSTATGFTGSLNGVAYTGTRTDFIDNGNSVSNLAGTYTGFNSTAFTPILPTSQVIAFISMDGFSANFASPITNPIFDIVSLVNTLDFGAPVTILSTGGVAGTTQAALQLTANGNGIIGVAAGNGDDAGGTIQLIGTFTSITATPTTAFNDGSGLLFISATPTAVPEPGSISLLVVLGVTGACFLRKRRK